MRYCYECGTLLEDRYLEDEGIIPFCKKCNTFRFPVFSTAVSMIVLAPEKDRILLIQQYGTGNNVLVAGYINCGESAEAAVIREVAEEIGLKVTSMHFNKSEYFKKSNTLMLNYTCTVDSDSLDGLNKKEVDKAQWFSVKDAADNIMQNSLAQRFLLNYLNNNERGEEYQK